jgi:hypothetical protein
MEMGQANKKWTVEKMSGLPQSSDNIIKSFTHFRQKSTAL